MHWKAFFVEKVVCARGLLTIASLVSANSVRKLQLKSLFDGDDSATQVSAAYLILFLQLQCRVINNISSTRIICNPESVVPLLWFE